MGQPPIISWPEGKRFAFTIFDDPDSQPLAVSRIVYSFLEELGFRTTKAVWPLGDFSEPNSPGETCASPEFLRHAQELQERGFEIGFHNATRHSVEREQTIRGLDRFREYFGSDPASMANHYNAEAIYWGPARLTGSRRAIYELVTRGTTSGKHFGEVEGHPAFWGDVCRARIRYCRNFVFRDIDTLRACPWMPYTDPLRPYVNEWYAASEGANRASFVECIGEANQDLLEERGGACIMYTHFGHGYVENGALHPRFRELMTRLSRKGGWFVPVTALLDYLRERNGPVTLTNAQRRSFETKWLLEKIFHGTS